MISSMDRGYLFIVTGQTYHDELKRSFPQLRRLTDLPICIASEKKLDLDCDFYVHIENPSFSYFDKVDNLDKTPFKETVYLDSDISFFHRLDEILDGLGGADLLASHEASLGLGPFNLKVSIPDAFPELSSGLIVYRKNDAFARLVECWRNEYRQLFSLHGIKHNQPSFRRALFKTDIKFSVLPPEYHFIPANFTRAVGSKIFCVHNHDFERARQIGNDLNARPVGEYSGYVDGLGVFRTPYAMGLGELIRFTWRTFRLLSYLLLRSVYISVKHGRKK